MCPRESVLGIFLCQSCVINRLPVISFRQDPSLLPISAELVFACLFLALHCPNTPQRQSISVISRKKITEMKHVFSLRVTSDLSYPIHLTPGL